MNFIKDWIQANLSRRKFVLLAALGLYHLFHAQHSAVYGDRGM